MASVHRATLLSFDPATWTAQVLIEGSDVEAQVPVGQWVPAELLTANTEVAVITFDPTNTDDAILIGPYGGTPMPSAVVTIGGLNLGSATGAAAGQLKASGGAALGGTLVITAGGFNVTGSGTLVLSDAATNTAPIVETLYHKTASTPVAGFGLNLYLQADDATTPQQSQFAIQSTWVDPAHATRKSRAQLFVNDATTGREVLRGESSGTAPMIGFLGAAAVARPAAYTQTYATAARTVANATALNPPAGGTGTAAGGYDTAANRNLMITSLTNAIADIAALKQVVNAIIDDLQAFGLFG